MRAGENNLTALARSPGWEHGSGSRARLVLGRQLPGPSERAHHIAATRLDSPSPGNPPISTGSATARLVPRRRDTGAKSNRPARQRRVLAIANLSRGEPASFAGGVPSREGLGTLPGFPCQWAGNGPIERSRRLRKL
jgi:hypothetical protein